MLWLLPVAAGAAWIYKIAKKDAPAGVPGNRIRMRDGSTVRRPPGLSDAAWAAIAEGQGVQGLLPAPIGSVSSSDGHEDWYLARTKSGWPNEMNRFGGLSKQDYFRQGSAVMEQVLLKSADPRDLPPNPYKSESWQGRAWMKGASANFHAWLEHKGTPLRHGGGLYGASFGGEPGDTDSDVDPADVFGLNERERELWVMNDEGLYNDWREWKRQQRRRGASTATRKYLRENREEIDAAINRRLGRGFGAWAADTDSDVDTESVFGSLNVSRMSAKQLRQYRTGLVRKYRGLLARRVQGAKHLRWMLRDGRQGTAKAIRSHLATNERRLAATWVQIARVQKILGNTGHPFVPPPGVPAVASRMGAW